jgi:acylphosphatase
MVKHFNISVFGLVQDVFFRDTAKQVADRLGVFGFIRNQPDGSVYAEIEGTGEALNEFIGWCQHGPDAARVDKLEGHSHK